MSEPASALSGPVRALFSDIDGTLTSDGKLEPETYSDLAGLVEAGVPVILVTGRPAGWGQALNSLAPLAAIITENGGLSFIGERKLYGLPEADLADWRARMQRGLEAVQRELPAAKLSSDSAYREVDLAIDWNEDVSLPIEDANRAVDILRAAGLRASRSSVHVNFSPPLFDKFTACQAVIERLFGSDVDLADFVYVGDALNDAPTFAGFPRAVGVANVRAWWDELDAKPGYVTTAAQGRGLRELIAHLHTLGPMS